jgi:bacterioferritin-associated ferredoxin
MMLPIYRFICQFVNDASVYRFICQFVNDASIYRFICEFATDASNISVYLRVCQSQCAHADHIDLG